MIFFIVQVKVRLMLLDAANMCGLEKNLVHNFVLAVDVDSGTAI